MSFPINTLVFSDWGTSTTFAFVDPVTGADLGQPPSAPTMPDMALNMATFHDGSVFVFKSNLPGSDAANIFNANFTARSTVALVSNMDLQSCVADDAGNVYWMRKNTGPSTFAIYKTDPSGTSTLVCTANRPGGNDPWAIAVDPTGTYAYVCDRVFGGATGTVIQVTLSSGATSTFKTVTSGAGYSMQSLICLGDGSVVIGWSPTSSEGAMKRYDSSGTLLTTYSSLPGTYNGAVQFAQAYTSGGALDTRFFVTYYDSASAGYGTTTALVQAGGTVDAHFTPAAGSFQWDGPFTAMRVAISTITPPALPSSPVTNTTEACCDPATPGTSTTGPILPSVDLTWQQSLTGGGTTEMAADPSDSENWAL